jgi:hypothetical protein
MSLVTLPEPLRAVVAGLIATLVTEGLKSLGALFGIDLSGKAAAVTAAIVTAVLFFIDSLLAQIPPEFEAVANAIFALLIAVGIHRQFVRFGGNL